MNEWIINNKQETKTQKRILKQAKENKNKTKLLAKARAKHKQKQNKNKIQKNIFCV